MITPYLHRLRAQPAAAAAHAALIARAPDAVLVGGAVRDLLVGRPLHDLDYVLPTSGLAVARGLANALGAAYYPLDVERGIGRVVWPQPDDLPLVIDISTLRDKTLAEDIWARDFTLNAIALLPDGQLFDPTGGADDLATARLRPCTPASLRRDPVRALRAVRFMHAFGLRPAPELDQLVPEAAGLLHTVSAERQRDEFFKLLALPAAAAACRQLRDWAIEPQILPEMAALAGVSQSLPHVFGAYEHTLAALQAMAQIDRLLRGEAVAGEAWEEEMMTALAPHLPALRDFLQADLTTGQPYWLWLRLAALAHDWGKPATRTVEESGRIRFFGHEDVSAQMVEAWAQRFRCANAAIAFLRAVCAAHMRPHHLQNGPQPPSRRALYHFYRDLEEDVPAVILLFLADHRATAGPGLPLQAWRQHLAMAATLMAAGQAEASAAILPPLLLNGDDLMALFDLRPGRHLGQLLEALREAQAVGEVQDRAQAEAFIRTRIMDDGR